MRIVTLAERPDLVERLEGPDQPTWPDFVVNAPVGRRCWGRLAEDFPEYQIVLVEGSGAQERIVAEGYSIPLHRGIAAGPLPPEGWDYALSQGCADFDAGARPDTASALSIGIAADRLGAGLSPVMVRGLRDVAAAKGFRELLVPLRPTHKARYPLIPMADYARWTRPGDDAPFDPWLRVHWRLGGRIVGPCERSMVVTGSVADWEKWGGLPMPATGRYVIDGALAPVEIDRERDLGRYVEPNVWVRHPIEDAAASAP
ncbi:hypothetical protein CLV63_102104 [Murinocardiopsis flavida]|uniref:Uncharacterized protein n=1 Tax=Murinocardiopsis flavida TaxID=645275 RepID=A0A2P8DRZ1_9ACTN|nr:hypothetical protein [Murinocardiopsis flavida]PSK99977.1 hypothetical protein CLV63_102104 [Murinocardiopsis flavida]